MMDAKNKGHNIYCHSQIGKWYISETFSVKVLPDKGVVREKDWG